MFSSTWLLFLLYFATTLCFALPIENSKSKGIEEDILVVEVDHLKPEPSLRKPRQDDGGDGGTDAGDAIGGLGAEAIGNNVIKVVTSALTGNVNGIFDGSFNLFGTGGTRNQVEGFFNSLVGGLVNGIIGSTTTGNPNKAEDGTGSNGNANPAVVAAVQATTSRPGSQYVILLNQSGGAIRGASLVNQQAGARKPAATTAAPATTKKADEDDDEEENEEGSRRSMSNLSR